MATVLIKLFPMYDIYAGIYEWQCRFPSLPQPGFALCETVAAVFEESGAVIDCLTRIAWEVRSMSLFFIFYGNMAADVRAWFQGIKQSSFHPSSLASGHGQSHWFLVRTLPPEFHYKDQAGQRLYSRLDPGRRWMPGQVYRALSDRHDHLERRFYAGRLFYRQLCVALW